MVSVGPIECPLLPFVSPAVVVSEMNYIGALAAVAAAAVPPVAVDTRSAIFANNRADNRAAFQVSQVVCDGLLSLGGFRPWPGTLQCTTTHMTGQQDTVHHSAAQDSSI